MVLPSYLHILFFLPNLKLSREIGGAIDSLYNLMRECTKIREQFLEPMRVFGSDEMQFL
jgi:hypothetical protein